jgi:hypothetical protein
MGRGGGYKAAKSHRHIVVVLWKMIDLENNPRSRGGGLAAVPDGGRAALLPSKVWMPIVFLQM